jgi:hypothetical protein
MPPIPAESSEPRPGPASARAAASGGWLEGLRGWLDRLLVLNVFVVLAGALWFGVGVALHLRGMEPPLDAFQRLWPLIFQPAIGLLMAAALLSGGLGWWQRRGQR